MASRSARSSPTRLLYSLCTTSASPAPSRAFTAALLTGNFHIRSFSAGSAAAARLRDEKEAWWKESLQKLRNIGISAHIDSGKTTLTERVLYYTGRIHEIHEVRGKDGVGAKMDSMDLEREKGITIQSAATYCNWKDYQTQYFDVFALVNIIDTPGHVDFTIEVERALRVLDGAILVLCSVGGVQSQSITVDRQMRRYEVPRLAFINKLDRMGADPWRVLNQARAKLRHHSAAVQIPIGLEDDFKGLIDLVNMKANYFHGSSGENVVIEDIPANFEELAQEKRRELIEAVSEVDDNLAEAFLSDEPISAAELEEAIRRATVARKFVPVFMGSAFKNKGVQPLLDGVLSYLPCPSEVSNYALDQTKNEEKVPRLVRMHSNEMEDIQQAHAGQIVAVFGVDCASGDTFTDGSVKYTMTSMSVPEPVMSLAISAVSKDSGGNFSKALNRFQKEDPTFRVGLDPESGQTIISGMGELHLDIYVERMRREYKVDAIVGKPRVNFRETITQRAEFDYLHKKQSGGQGIWNHFHRALVLSLNSRTCLWDKLYPLILCQQLKRVLKRLPTRRDVLNSSSYQLAQGSLIGHPVENIRIVLNDGAAHTVDSSELAFKLASIYAFRQCYTAAKPVILEPVMLVELKFPSEFQGSVTGDINKRKGIIVGNDQEGDDCVITAHVPLNNMFGYSTSLRSMTQGKGEFTMEYLEHSQVSQDVQTQLVNAHKATKGGD
ncbi:elongation factor G [Striga asiatica]|uniref:Elongation factor G, mitochondrial n=1 Tax=Striga asiatica TaxID=4170 RepID=A0A5A7PG00_STRAF|nr:elongation factor G [Striga asiatica]